MDKERINVLHKSNGLNPNSIYQLHTSSLHGLYRWWGSDLWNLFNWKSYSWKSSFFLTHYHSFRNLQTYTFDFPFLFLLIFIFQVIANGSCFMRKLKPSYNPNSPWQTLGRVDTAVYGAPPSDLTRRKVSVKDLFESACPWFPCNNTALSNTCCVGAWTVPVIWWFSYWKTWK